MRKKRIAGLLTAGLILVQSAAEMPAASAFAASPRRLSLTDFAAQVQAMTATDGSRDFFETLEFDTASGTLTADGEPTDHVGDLSVRGGRLMLQTGALSGKTGVRSGGAYTSFASAAEDAGFSYTQTGSVMTITNEFQTARLIVKSSGAVPHDGAVSVAEGFNDLHILQYATPADAYAAYQRFSGDAQIAYVQPSHRVSVCAETAAASYNTWGADCIGVKDFMNTYLNAEVLPEVIVSVIDTGINMVPALFEGRILDNGINISDSGDDTVEDDYGHGTHCTGTICELTPSTVKIIPVKVFDLNGTASDEQIYLGIVYSIEQGADVINMSFGGLGVSPLEIEALDIAEEHGVVCCAAAGNNSDDAVYYYPGGFASCITVGAVDSDMELGSFSNFGRMIDVVAPGVGVLSYVLGEEETLESWNGTSMATPHAAACCALLRTYDPEMSPRRVEAILQRNAVDLGDAGFDETFGWGLVCLRDLSWDDGICMQPEYDAKTGNYGVQVTIAISCDTEGAQIYYTTDGTEPSPENGTLYTEPLNITESTLLHAVAVKEGCLASAPSEAVYTIGGKDIADALEIRDGVLTRYRGVSEKLTVPESVNGETVTAVGMDAFRGNHFTEDVVLPQTVTEIAEGAFSGCSRLQGVSAPGAVSIGAHAFEDCAQLQSVMFAPYLEDVGEKAFCGCSTLVTLDLTGIPVIPDSVCAECKALQQVLAPNAYEFGSFAFQDCVLLERLDCDWPFVTAIGPSAFAGCRRWQGKLCLERIESLGEGAFSGDSSLLQLSLPDHVTVLPPYLLKGCSGLKILQLPGVRVISDYALALGDNTVQPLTELEYHAVTKVGTNGFFGFAIGSGDDCTEFSSLKEMSERSFAGAKAGGLHFPQIRTVPENAFADGQIGYVVLESAEKLAQKALYGVKAAVVTESLTALAENAYPEGMWVVAEQLPAVFEGAEVPFSFCDEPLVMMGQPENNVTVQQHRRTVLRVLACGFHSSTSDQFLISGLKRQWFLVDGETETEIAGAASDEFIPPTDTAGTFVYRCVVTDAGGKTEQAIFRVEVTEEETVPPELAPAQQCFAPDAVDYTVNVSESGTYTFLAYGGAPVRGILMDESGQTVGEFRYSSGNSFMSAQLRADTRYTLYAAPLWYSEFSVRMLRGKADGLNAIQDCGRDVKAEDMLRYGSQLQPSVVLSSQDGSILKQGKDYDVRVQRHNQTCTVAVYGMGQYYGYYEQLLTVYQSIPADTPIPVSLNSKQDTAVYAFVPGTSGTYYYYGTYGDGYAREQEKYYRLGGYSFRPEYINLRTHCIVTDRNGTVVGQSYYSSFGGPMFGSSLTLDAGQTYFLYCSGESSTGGKAAYSLVVTQERHDISRAAVSGIFFDFYRAGQSAEADVTVTLRGQELTKGVDYQTVLVDGDVPGTTRLLITGIGLYYGSLTRDFEIAYNGRKLKGELIALDETVSVDCADSRVTFLRFAAEAGETDQDTVRYRVINSKTTGGLMKFSLYAFDETTGSYTAMSPVSEQQDGDFMLRNGTYCLAVYRANPDRKSAADITVVIPHDLENAEVTIGDMPYTGADVYPPITVTASDGTVLEQGKDYSVTYPDRHTLFGTTRVVLRATNRSYGTHTEYFEIYVQIPEDPPEITVGSHEAVLTFDDRLAFYKLTADTDTEYTLSSTDAANQVLRVFTPDAELVAQDYGHQPKSVSFTVPAGETRYLMVKFNGTDRCGTVHFRLETDLRLLKNCDIESEPVFWTGERVLPEVTFCDGDYILQEGVDYSLRYTEKDVRIGTASANYVGMGRYFGTCDVEYYIVSENLLEDEQLEPMMIALDTVYAPQADLEEEYVTAMYVSGLDEGMLLTVLRSECRLHVQRYDAEGKFVESISAYPDGAMRFDLTEGCPCYFVFTAQDVSGSNQSFRFSLSDPECPEYNLVNDSEHGVTYRVFPSLNYAEVYKLNLSAKTVTLQPFVGGTEVRFVPEGLFTNIPNETVIYGCAGCAAAVYAEIYGFAYVELPAVETIDKNDINGDGACTLADAVLLSHMISEHDGTAAAEWQLLRADFNSDGMLDIRDLRELLRFLAEF